MGNMRQANWYGGKWIRAEKRLAIYIRDNFICQYCGKDLKHVHNPRKRQLDHVIPCLNGKPDNDAANLITACELCNTRKNGHNLLDFLKGDLIKADCIFAQLAKPIDVQAAKVILTEGNTNS